MTLTQLGSPELEAVLSVVLSAVLTRKTATQFEAVSYFGEVLPSCKSRAQLSNHQLLPVL